MDILASITHDEVIRASASTYDPRELSRLGLQITLNLSRNKTRFIGDVANPVYPEIIIWRPDYFSADSGQTVIVEAIETTQTVNFNLNKWRFLSSLDIRFVLVIPLSQVANVRNQLHLNHISNVVLQTYTFNPLQNRYIFNGA